MAGAKQFDPDAALERAMQVFRTRGFGGTSMQDLEAATGLGRGSIYNAFGDKHALFVATLERYVEQHEASMRAMLTDAPDALEGIALAIRSHAVTCSSSAGQPGCFIGNTAMDRANHDAQVAAFIESAVGRMTELFRETLERAQREGSFPAERDALTTARFLVMSVQGLSLMAKASPHPKQVRSVAEEILRALR